MPTSPKPRADIHTAGAASGAKVISRNSNVKGSEANADRMAAMASCRSPRAWCSWMRSTAP